MKKVLLEDHSEAIPPACKKLKVVVYLKPETLAALENYRLFEMGMAKRYRTLGQALDEVFVKHNAQLAASDYFNSLWISTVHKGRRIMEKYMARKQASEKVVLGD